MRGRQRAGAPLLIYALEHLRLGLLDMREFDSMNAC